jgi:hypothetical protein
VDNIFYVHFQMVLRTSVSQPASQSDRQSLIPGEVDQSVRLTLSFGVYDAKYFAVFNNFVYFITCLIM